LGVSRCLQALVDFCINKFVVLRVDATNLLGVISSGSPKLPLNVLARELFRFCLANNIAISVEWVPRESKVSAD
jgi:hypothetical protein